MVQAQETKSNMNNKARMAVKGNINLLLEAMVAMP